MYCKIDGHVKRILRPELKMKDNMSLKSFISDKEKN